MIFKQHTSSYVNLIVTHMSTSAKRTKHAILSPASMQTYHCYSHIITNKQSPKPSNPENQKPEEEE